MIKFIKFQWLNFLQIIILLKLQEAFNFEYSLGNLEILAPTYKYHCNIAHFILLSKIFSLIIKFNYLKQNFKIKGRSLEE